MTEQDLLRRIEEQAAEIADLKRQVESLTETINKFPNEKTKIEVNLLKQMEKAAVNCGMSYGCSYARRVLEGML